MFVIVMSVCNFLNYSDIYSKITGIQGKTIEMKKI